jgi:CubicO group peptidase (beta-lactamase class C family)
MRNYILLLSGLVLLNACKQQPEPLIDASSETAPNVFVQAGEQADRLLNAFMGSEGSPPGLSVAISIDGQILYARGFGYSDLETKDPVTAKTRFRAASVSKMMTATAMAVLMQEERLDADATIQEYSPAFPEKTHPISPRLLAGHLSGIAHYSPGDRIEKRFYASVNEALAVFSHQDLLFEPGTGYAYSTHGYTLLSSIVEGASGKPFLEYMDQEIFRPLGMLATGPHMINEAMKDMTQLYSIDGSGKASAVQDAEDPSYKWGAGGMVSTPSDLVRLGNAYMNGFLKSETVKEMFQSQKRVSGEETGVGIGWRTSRDFEGRRVFEHAGSMEGTRSYLGIFPDQKFSIAIMSNSQRPHNIEETAHVLSSLFLSKSQPGHHLRATSEVTYSGSTQGDKVEGKGDLFLDGIDDRLVLEDALGQPETHRMMYLQRDSVYAVVTGYGILFATVDLQKDRVLGKVIRYGSPRLRSPAIDVPFIVFEGPAAP